MFTLTANKFASRDHQGKIKHIEHIRDPYISAALDEPDAEQLADEYLTEVAPIYQLQSDITSSLNDEVPKKLGSYGAQLHRSNIKDVAGSIIVTYCQSVRGLPIWRADFSVHIASNPMRVTSSTSSLHEDISLGNESVKIEGDLAAKYTPQTVSKLLGLKNGKKVTKVNQTRLVVYRFAADRRYDPDAHKEGEANESFAHHSPTLDLPPLAQSIVDGVHYITVEVLFDLATTEFGNLHWRVFVEPETGSVLYLRALVSAATGKVFKLDPISSSGNVALIPSADQALLNACRSNVVIPDLNPANPQPLEGSWIDLHEIEPPAQAAPTKTPPVNFDYNVKTTDFAAVNAYYHTNWFFNLIKGMGFNLTTYFDNTEFPVKVDHWGLGGAAAVNAHCPGNATGNGIGHFCFASAQAGETVGIANDVRVVIHEFGHALLWDHVNSPNFGFAHSAGDALAAILMDPNSKAPDRFLTFPWPQSGTGPLDRRHDRAVADGWGWFGANYNTQYKGEQVLSTTLFRIYRSVGGDSPHLNDRKWAARYTSYLIIKAIGSLTTTTNDPEVFVTALMNADLTTTNFEGHPGGALHKVIRWAFEKQGLFQANAKPNLPPGTPKVTAEGNAPDVDVYINDGRNGQYSYLYSFWESNDIWVRRKADGGTTHQAPALGKTNYMYVRVRNRGTQTAHNVRVKAYHCDPGTGLAWPHHWSPMSTPILSASSSIAPGGSVIIGPFQWIPENFGHECLLAIASADGDPGNDTTVMGSIPHSRFVPFDNNIGQRNVHPIFVIDWLDIIKAVKKIPFQVVNPYKTAAKIELFTVLPSIMTKDKLWLLFTSKGGNKFELGPYETRKVTFDVVNIKEIPRRRPWTKAPVSLKPGILPPEAHFKGEEIDLPDNPLRTRPVYFRVIALINGENMGGMTYEVQTRKTLPGRLPVDFEDGEGDEAVPDTARFLETLKAQSGVKGVRVRKVNVDIEFDD